MSKVYRSISGLLLLQQDLRENLFDMRIDQFLRGFRVRFCFAMPCSDSRNDWRVARKSHLQGDAAPGETCLPQAGFAASRGTRRHYERGPG